MIWYRSIHFLGFSASEESIIRFTYREITKQLAESVPAQNYSFRSVRNPEIGERDNETVRNRFKYIIRQAPCLRDLGQISEAG